MDPLAHCLSRSQKLEQKQVEPLRKRGMRWSREDGEKVEEANDVNWD